MSNLFVQNNIIWLDKVTRNIARLCFLQKLAIYNPNRFKWESNASSHVLSWENINLGFRSRERNLR